jgi:hypothetical protein
VSLTHLISPLYYIYRGSEFELRSSHKFSSNVSFLHYFLYQRIIHFYTLNVYLINYSTLSRFHKSKRGDKNICTHKYKHIKFTTGTGQYLNGSTYNINTLLKYCINIDILKYHLMIFLRVTIVINIKYNLIIIFN